MSLPTLRVVGQGVFDLDLDLRPMGNISVLLAARLGPKSLQARRALESGFVFFVYRVGLDRLALTL